MDSQNQLIGRIQQRLDEMRGPLPNAEIRWLSGTPGEPAALQADLDLYLADLAGYAHRPQRLRHRSTVELEAALDFLAVPFFERYPQHQFLHFQLTAQSTPALHRELELAELIRLDLGELIRTILAPSPSVDAR